MLLKDQCGCEYCALPDGQKEPIVHFSPNSLIPSDAKPLPGQKGTPSYSITPKGNSTRSEAVFCGVRHGDCVLL